MKNASNPTPEVLAALEKVPDLYLILSVDFNILTATTTYLKATSQKRESIKGKYIFDVFPDNPEVLEADATLNLRKSLEWVLENKLPHQMGVQRYDILLPNSINEFEKKYWLPLNSPVLDADGEIEYIIHKVSDITDQVKARLHFSEQQDSLDQKLKIFKEGELFAQAEVQKQYSLMQSLLNNAPVAMALYEGKDQVIIKANNMMYQIWGREPEEVFQKPLLEALPELAGQGFDEQIREVYFTGIPYKGNEVPAQLVRNGQIQTNYYNFAYEPLYNEQGRMLGVLNVALEVTDMVLARKQVEESEQKLRLLNKDLNAANNEIMASNEEIRAANEELLSTKQSLQDLNQELEERIARRTKELQLAQAEAERQSKRLESLFMQAPAAICILDGPEMVYELVNPNYASLFPKREFLGRPILEVLPEIKESLVYKTFQDVYQTGITHNQPELLIPFVNDQTGQVEDRYFRYVQQARFNEQGKVDGIVVFALEITEQVEARKAVEQIAERLQLITDALPVLIGYLDKEEKYQFANKAYEAWFNRPPSELLGKTVRSIVGDTAYKGVKVYIDRALQGERLDFESRMPYRENFVKYIKTSYVPDSRNGQVEGFYTLVNDVTEQVEARNSIEKSEKQAKEIAEELRLANEQLTRTNIDLDNFIYTASHDLKAPISNIEGLINIMVDSLPEHLVVAEGLDEVLEMIRESIRRFKRTIDHLTEVVKLQKENNQEVVRVNLEQVLEEVKLDLAPQLKAAGATIDADLKDCSGINFTQKNLRSIVYNLVSNAVKYHSPDRRPLIKIRCRPAGDYILLTVQDNGLGMALDENTKLFTMFTRLHDHVEGSGIGLYMVKKIVENAGGRIDVESEVGKGTTFNVYFKN